MSLQVRDNFLWVSAKASFWGGVRGLLADGRAVSRQVNVGEKAIRMKTREDTIPMERIEDQIYTVRGKRVMLDSDLARLYGVETRRLNEQVRRNAKRFPEDFAFQLTNQEVAILMSQNATSSAAPGGHGGRRYLPYAFTEQGVAMLSSVLRSKRAVQVNIEIVHAFVRLREMLASNAALARKLAALVKKTPRREGGHFGIQ